MEEVIFNGTREMKPLGMAEVTLSLVNNRGVLPTEYTEVQITRRLFRSGESEYLLNKVPCRLKDITELFYDTGVGAHSYSVIQQDMIEAVISDKAEERRFLFEEAAGITKYKQRKRAAIRKLESTENDFLRLSDIYAEVKTQANSLRRQQKKAERYQKISDSVRQWELFLGSKRIRKIEDEIRNTRSQRDSLGDQLAGKDTHIDKLSSELEGQRKEQIDIEQELARVSNEVYEASEKAHGIEKEISIRKEKKSNAATLIERNQNDIVALKNRLELLGEQSQETETSLTSHREDLKTIESDLGNAEADQAEADRRLLEARASRERENKQLLELEGKLSSGKTEEENLKQQSEELKSTFEASEGRIEECLKQRKTMEEELEERRTAVQDAINRKASCEASAEEQSQRLEQLLDESDNLTQEISSLTASVEGCQARKHLLEEMMLQYEGYESGVKAAMDVRERWPGIYGTVAEKFVPVEGLEIAVEAALGEMARFIICDSRATGESIIRYLRAENKGKAGLLVPDTGTINPAVKRPELDLPGFVGWLDTLVSTDEHLKPLMQAVLARTAVFEAEFSPDEILERLPYGFKAVSTVGDVYSKNIISGGSDDRLPLFRRREKVAEQEKMMAELERQLAQVQARKNKTVADIATVRAELNRLTDRIDDLGEDVETARANAAEKEYELKGLDGEIKRLETERKSLRDKIERMGHRQYTLGLDFSQLAGQRQELEDNIAHSVEKLQDLETAANRSIQIVSGLQVKLVEARSRIEQTESKLRHLKELADDITNTIDIKAREIGDARNLISDSEASVERLEAELKETFGLRQEISDRQNTLRATQGELMERVSVREKDLKKLRAERESINDEAHRLDIRLSTANSEMTSICERVRDEYGVDIRTADTANPNETLSEAEAEQQLAETKERLKNFGAVNLLALEEYKIASERKAFLEEQLKDLTEAKEDLQTTIIKINHTARQMFLETFNQVKVNFKNLFVELFTGGEADIFLRDPSDPLESDIEIIARPKGKKLLSITMMSGGERALTAISLLFSLYLVKPSPFCILDEIDAPLDDANCHRFLRIIRKFSEQTQFIVITHNKITMEAAHNLYGVTMEQFGVSKMVAVRFADSELDESPGEFAAEDENYGIDARVEPGNGNTPEQQPDTSGGDEELPERVVQRLNPSTVKPNPSDDSE